MTTVDKSKTYTTRTGLPVRIYATDGHDSHGGYVHGAIQINSNYDKSGYAWTPASWFSDGTYCGQLLAPKGSLDLIPQPRTVEVDFWVNVYAVRQHCYLYESRGEADREAGPDRVACLHIKQTVTEGDGL